LGLPTVSRRRAISFHRAKSQAEVEILSGKISPLIARVGMAKGSF
jgi:hypothetical protein